MYKYFSHCQPTNTLDIVNQLVVIGLQFRDSRQATVLAADDIEREYEKATEVVRKFLPREVMFVFGIISNRKLSGKVILPDNCFLVSSSECELYYTLTFVNRVLYNSCTYCNYPCRVQCTQPFVP